MNFICVKTMLVAAAAMVSLSSFSQDLIARQAPIDRKLKSVDSLALQKQIRAEQAAFPAYSLYPSWNNEYVHAYGRNSETVIPESFTIDLRGFYMPTPSRKITSPFGPRWRRMHNGLDLKVEIGDTIRAAFDGKVRIVKYEARGYGKYIVIRHANGLETIYGHLSKQLVDPDQIVKAGEIIGLGGNTGHSTGSHLHFETRFLGIAINPALMFDFPNQDVVADTYTFNRNSRYERKGATAVAASNDAGDDNVIKYHKVHRGDTLSKIAKERGVTIAELRKMNGLTKKSRLKPGQIIRCS
nr:M23 family metallopeptidase [uncultured Bacteroides sp.]